MSFRLFTLFLVFSFCLFSSGCAPTTTAQQPQNASAETYTTSASSQECLSAASTPKALNTDECYTSAYDKYYALGQFYQQRYVSDLVFDASVEIEKIKSAQFLRDTLLTRGIISEVSRTSHLKTHFDEYDAAQHIDIDFSAPTFQLNDPASFYDELLHDEFLSYFSLKKKVGSWWVYLDLSDVVLWEKYFWIAYLTEQGFEPEYSTELQLLVLGNFVSAEEALLVKEKLPMIPVQVAMSVYRPYSIDEMSLSAKMLLSDTPDTTNRPVSTSATTTQLLDLHLEEADDAILPIPEEN